MEQNVGLGHSGPGSSENSMRRPHVMENVADNCWKTAGICHLKNDYTTALGTKEKTCRDSSTNSLEEKKR